MMQAYTEEQKAALIGRLNQIAEKLKWHNAAYAQDVLLAVDALNATAPQPIKLPQPLGWKPPSGRDVILRESLLEALKEQGYQVEE